MTLKLRILRSLTMLFIILVSLTRSLFSEKMIISNRCISGLMPNLIKKSWTISTLWVAWLLLALPQWQSFVNMDQLLNIGSDKVIYWIGRYFSLLSFILSKQTKVFWFFILIKSSINNLSRFLDVIKPKRKEYQQSCS